MSDKIVKQKEAERADRPTNSTAVPGEIDEFSFADGASASSSEPALVGGLVTAVPETPPTTISVKICCES